METIGNLLAFACLISVIVSQIWLILIIMRGSPGAALLCLIVPFLVLFFIRDHWELARKPVIFWAGGIIGFIPAAILMSMG